MNIYFSGISGTGIGPLAELAKDAGHQVFGSDSAPGMILTELTQKGIKPSIGEQTGEYLREVNDTYSIDWLVYSSALPANHPELTLAKELGIKTTKRDDFLSHFIEEKGLKLIAVAGTHGKTTTTSMLIWTFLQLGIPVSYAVGTTLSFAPSGRYDPKSQFFLYEADEYDRNFLKFYPFISVLPSISYDHPDIYLTEKDYIDAFKQFVSQSHKTYMWFGSSTELAILDRVYALIETNPKLTLPGISNRANATMALTAASDALGLSTDDDINVNGERTTIADIINKFPGSKRRFEKLADNLYTDYAHHPDEIAATLQIARELSNKVAVIYQPHQNTRQHKVRHLYRNAFKNADKVYWLPTYLTREDRGLATLTPAELIGELSNGDVAEPAELDENLLTNIKNLLANGYLVILLTAGPADAWLREHLAQLKQ